MRNIYNRSDFIKTIGLVMAGAALPGCVAKIKPGAGPAPDGKPNIILCMADDLGWGDTGYTGHPVLKTPHLDSMAHNGIRFDRFYSGAPVCSPTRGSCLTGRHPYRYGIFSANVGHMLPEEITLAEALKTRGYTTGHFGKWHLGTLTRTEKDSNRGGPRGALHHSPPWENGFDKCFSTEAKVPTWDPMKEPGTGKPYGTYYWKEDGTKETENLEGDDSRIIMDRAIPFIENAARENRPFLAIIWFHAPHLPTVAGPEYRRLYHDQPDKNQHYYGCITALDEQVGRLRRKLRELGIAGNTMLWFCGDNGPEGEAGELPGSAGPFRGRKRSLFEGGVRVPGILEWPDRIEEPRVISMPCCTSDYFPTVMEILSYKIPEQPEPIDGISLLPLIDGTMKDRPVPIAFESKNQLSLSDNRYKLISQDSGETYMLFDLLEDPGETRDLAAQKPEVAAAMRKTLAEWRASCKASQEGRDYR